MVESMWPVAYHYRFFVCKKIFAKVLALDGFCFHFCSGYRFVLEAPSWGPELGAVRMMARGWRMSCRFDLLPIAPVAILEAITLRF